MRNRLSFDVRHHYGKDGKEEMTSEHWVIETHPFSINAHRIIVDISEEDALALKARNPELNIRLANDEDYEDESIEWPQMNWHNIAEKELANLRMRGETWLPACVDELFT